MKAIFANVITRLTTEPVYAAVELADLLDKWNLIQLTSLLAVLKTRLDVIAAFEQLIRNDQVYELWEDESVHRTLERNMWLLDDAYWIAQSNGSLRTFIRGELPKLDKRFEKGRPDFACVDALGKTVIVEIRRPTIELKKQAVDQAELYLRLIRKHHLQSGKPEVILIGSKISPEAGELADMRGYPTLLTYHDLIETSRRKHRKYLKIVNRLSIDAKRERTRIFEEIGRAIGSPNLGTIKT